MPIIPLYTGLALGIAGERILLHRASPVYSQMGYIGTGLALCIADERILLHRASPVYSQMRYNWHRASIYTNPFNRWRHIIVN